MHIHDKIQKFLLIKLKHTDLTRKIFAKESNILYRTVCDILGDNNSIPSIVTILKIAHYFNCSIDEVLGRKEYIKQNSYKYTDIDTVLSNWNTCLKNYIKSEIYKKNISPYKLSQKLGFNSQVILAFINDPKTTRIINSTVVVGIADYFNVSIDKMIGRTSSTDSDNQNI
jgi:transcriptional regulator with XRE-family HTH domain